MASVLRVPKKRQIGTTSDGKPIWKATAAVMYYAKLKTLEGAWTQRPTKQPTKALALKWAQERCACDGCGGAERLRKAAAAMLESARAAEEARARRTCGELMDDWIETLTNRSAKDDRSRLAKHVRPAFADMRPEEVTLPLVMKWIDSMRATKAAPPPLDKRGKPKLMCGRQRASAEGRLSDATIRHVLNLLSRFFSWAVERGHAAINPVRLIPSGKRPRQSAKDENRPWIDDTKTVRDLMKALAPPFREMFYLANRSGLRPGEQRGLRMSDLGFLSDGVIRVRYSDDGCLKEDKRQEGRAKWVPAADDAAAALARLLERRRAEGAQPEDHVFLPELTRGAVKQRMADAWKEATDVLGLSIGFYEAGRHSFASRNLQRGASLDEVSAALGHSSPVTTRRHYDHFIRKQFSSTLREGLGATENTEELAEVIQLHQTKSTAHG